MAAEDIIVLNDWRIQAGGNLKIESLGDGKVLSVCAPGDKGTVGISAQGAVAMTAGGASVMVSQSDGAAFIAGEKAVKLGAAVAGGTIELTASGVTIQLTPAVSIKLSMTGIVMQAGATKLAVELTGITASAPMISEKAEAVRQVDQGLSKDAAKGPRQINAPLDNIGA